MQQAPFSEYIVYVDESGDQSLSSINRQNPVFVLAFLIFHKETYRSSVVPAVQKLKFDFWGHDGIIFHGHDIRKSKADFNILLNPVVRAQFMDAMTCLVAGQEFTIIAAAIDKARLSSRYVQPRSPYEIALKFCMERLQRWLIDKGQGGHTTHVMVECRGRKEDAELELEFRRIAGGGNQVGAMPNLSIRFMDKKHNSSGLQLADLVAHPIGRHVIAPDQPNRAFEALRGKFRRASNGDIAGMGLKIFP